MHGDLQSYDGSVAVVRSLSLREAAQKFNPCRVEPRINDPVMAPCFYATYAFYILLFTYIAL